MVINPRSLKGTNYFQRILVATLDCATDIKRQACMQITHFVQGVVVVAAVVCIRKVLGQEGEVAMKLCPCEVARHLLSSLVISKAGTDCR